MATSEVTPAGVKSKGYMKVAWLKTLTSPTAVSLTSDITSSNCLNLSFYLVPTFTPTLTQNKGVDDRLGAVAVGEALGNKTWSTDNFNYLDDPQSTSTTSAKGILQENQSGFLMVRFGILATVDWAAMQLVYLFPATLGGRVPIATTTDEFGKWAYQQELAIGLGVLENLAIAA